MNTHGNARSTASKASIRDAMLALLEESTLDKISVQDIVKKAGVNRSTFYAHYLDIHDLMEKMEREMVTPLTTEMYAEGSSADTIFSADALMKLIAYFRANRVFYRIFFTTSTTSKLIQEAAIYVRQRFIEPQLEKANQFTREEYAFQFEFAMSGFLGVICKWLDGGCVEPDSTVAGVLQKMIWKCLA